MAGVILGGVLLHAVAPAAAISSTPAYVLGVSSPLDPLVVDLKGLTSPVTILPTLSDLSLVGGNSVLFVDGSWLVTASSLDPTILSLLVGKILQGIPTVTVRGNPMLLAGSISGLLKWHPLDLPLIAEGVRITDTLADGTRRGGILQVLDGFDYAVNSEFHWAELQLSQAAPSVSTAPKTSTGSPKVQPNDVQSTQPYWSLIIHFSIDTGNYFAPYGRIISTLSVFGLMNDGTNNYNWYNVFLNQTIQPGIMVYKSDYNSDWRTYIHTDSLHVTNTTSTMFVDHGPAGVSNAGPFVVSYDVGVTATLFGAVVNATQAQSYFLKHTTVTDSSQNGDVSWVHDIEARTQAGTLTFQITPGWTTRYLQGAHAQFEGTFSTIFAELQGNTLTASQSKTVTLAVG